MSVDFALVFIVAAIVCGVIWLVDSFFLKPQRANLGGETAKEPLLVEYAKSFFPIIVIVLVFRSFLFEPFRIPSNSMVPTLLTGDFILVNKYSYGLRWPVLNKKFADTGSPKRGDVVVFRNPREPSKHYIKRLVGLPGDEIQYVNKRLTINGEEMGLSLESGAAVPSERVRCRSGRRDDVLLEDLGSVTHEIRLTCAATRRHPTVFRVPEGQYFMMGDNRDNSQDSRFANEVGYIPEQYLVGKAVRIWMHWGSDWGRIGNKIQ